MKIKYKNTTMESRLNRALIKSKENGYWINEEGDLINPKGYKIEGCISNRGYRYTSIKLESKVTKLYFHRLQGFQKFGDKIFEKGFCVRHLNGNSLDNSVSNIEIGTYYENSMDIPKEVRLSSAIKASSFIKIHNHDKIRSFHKTSGSYKETMKYFNISSKGTLNYILNK
jgi:hypothetical protein